MESYFCMDSERRKRRIRIRIKKPRPFKSKIKHFIKNNKTSLLFLLFIFCFAASYFLILHSYWRYIYTQHGFGYLFND